MVQVQHEVHSVIIIKISWSRRTAIININLNITMFILMHLCVEQSVLFITKNKMLLLILSEKIYKKCKGFHIRCTIEKGGNVTLNEITSHP